MLERSHSFNIRDKDYDDIQRIMENVLEKDLSFSTNSKRLGRSLLRINYFDTNVDRENQKNNRITILQEPEKRIYVQINGKLTDSQVGQFWNEFENHLNRSIEIKKDMKLISLKDDMVREIKELIDERGYLVKSEDVQEFVENFIEKYDRFPKKDEIYSIVKGYIVMVNEEKLFDNNGTDLIADEKNMEKSEPILEKTPKDLSLTSNDSTVLVMSDGVGRRKCPVCGNDGLIHEMDDKNVILLDYPKIYGKKNCCADCGHEWREY
ncbi:MAG: hypothetical protein HWN81_04965 [Candidatus Lokiarchaeota archaeon]|nr:hypothetical protein [Candidatus Lokiarchaeota archaeon]